MVGDMLKRFETTRNLVQNMFANNLIILIILIILKVCAIILI